ncbi:MAG: hypothetical protein E6J69_17920 [Deltaproteobacteria bacterium]|nr:MAG: hypothetical protein E6J69_17920 [Deltaproteobacteria bacterium]
MTARYTALEPRVRRAVAENLGVALDELTPEVSLTDDLAADSLDLLELALALESEFDISVPERVLDEVRTYGELVRATLALVQERHAAEAEPVLFRARVVPAGRASGALERAGWLTPHAAEMIVEDALHAGPGAQLSVTIAANADPADVARVKSRLGRLSSRGIAVSVSRAGHSKRARRERAA